MSHENVTVIHRLYEAFGQGDIPTVLGSMDADITWIGAENSLYAGESPYTGINAVVENVLMRIGVDWDNFAIQVDELLDAGDKVVMLGYYSGIYKTTGKQILAQVSHVWTLEGGKIVKFQQYTDTKQFAQITESLPGVLAAA
ncbi:MAG: nuclear transport factor 2 family protein [Caldilineaceae bacterium]|nr:nuclear transport factor 2 family protein [Caldilineaceae bacterium]